MASLTRSRGQIVLAVVFTLLGLNAWAQVFNAVIGDGGDPAALVVLQIIVGASGLAAAWGSWRGSRWAPAAAVTYGVVTAAMLASLGPLLELAPEEVRGIWIGAASILLASVAAGWYLRRRARVSRRDGHQVL